MIFLSLVMDPFLNGLKPLRGVGLVTAGGTETPLDFIAISFHDPNLGTDFLFFLTSTLFFPAVEYSRRHNCVRCFRPMHALIYAVVMFQ